MSRSQDLGGEDCASSEECPPSEALYREPVCEERDDTGNSSATIPGATTFSDVTTSSDVTTFSDVTTSSDVTGLSDVTSLSDVTGSSDVTNLSDVIALSDVTIPSDVTILSDVTTFSDVTILSDVTFPSDVTVSSPVPSSGSRAPVGVNPSPDPLLGLASGALQNSRLADEGSKSPVTCSSGCGGAKGFTMGAE